MFEGKNSKRKVQKKMEKAKKKRLFFSNLPLQWRLTLVTALLVVATCILMFFFLGHSAISGMDDLQNYVIEIDSTDTGTPVKFSVDPKSLFPQLAEQMEETRRLFLFQSVVATLIILAAGSISTYFITRHALSPLRHLSEKLHLIQAQNLSEPIAVPDTHDELSELTRAFNDMLARLDAAFTVQKQFAASAAHELRTPLAVMQTNLDVFARKKKPQADDYETLFSMIREQTERLTHLSSVLLDMTGIQTASRTDLISLAALTDEVFCDLDCIAADHQIELLQEDGDCTLTGNYLLLYRAVYNLVENAIKYNHPGGSVAVSITQKEHTAVLSVTDTGIGISKENQDKIFLPFFRVDKSRSRAMGGAGLGLALVNEIVKHHNGQIRVADSNSAGTTGVTKTTEFAEATESAKATGTTIELTLPLSPTFSHSLSDS